MQFREENFWYTTGWSAAVSANGGTATGQILLSADAMFKAYYITMHVRQGAAAAEVIVLNAACDVLINEAQVGKNMSNAAMPVDALVSNGQNMYVLAPPRIFTGNTTILFTWTSNVATRTQFNAVLHGAKLIPTQAAPVVAGRTMG